MTSPLGTGIVSQFSPSSGNPFIDPFIVGGYRWSLGGLGAPATITYSFPQNGATWIGDYYDGEPFDGFQSFNASQQAAARQALALWQDVANITFVETAETPADVGDIRFGFSAVVSNDPNAVAWGYFPYASPSFEFPEAGDIWLDPLYQPNLQMAPGQFGFTTLIHEIGHALGLDHPFDDGNGDPVLPPSLDNFQYTVMSYTDHPTASIEPMSPMLLDIVAIQYIYGANMNTRTGNDTYTFSNTKEELRAIWDAGGVDTVDCGNQTLAVTIDLNEGAFSSIGRRNNGGSASNNIAIAYGAAIENATGGSGSDVISGNALANLLVGGLGNDYLDGRAGADTLWGGKGNDTYVMDDVGDVIDEQGNTDSGDEIRTSMSVGLATLAGGAIERATAIGAGAISLVGNNAANILTGNTADNYLEGGYGNDTLRGGAGNDTYFVETAGDIVDEQSNKDTSDWVRTRVTLNLASFAAGAVENATLWSLDNIGITGNGAANILYGGTGNNAMDGAGGSDIIWGNDGKDTLNGGVGNDYLDGGTGSDILRGGAGNDIYVIDSLADVVDEQGSKDIGDELRATFSVDLSKVGGGALDRAFLMGASAADATGNERANSLMGNDADNVLSGAGGADILIGGGGKDTLLGGTAADWLDGGTGNDLLFGGSGNDRYVIDSPDDIIDEELNQDTGDEVRVKISVDLAVIAGGKLEIAVLDGATPLDASGNQVANLLWGNDAANVLDGREGNDTLLGNGGDDTLVGGEGNDSLDGGAGDDVLKGGNGFDKLMGGAGNDVYVLDDLNDTLDEGTNNDSGDEVRAGLSLVLSNFAAGRIENATLLGADSLSLTGTAANNKLVGNSAGNTLLGLGGDDVLDGGGGVDLLKGGAGNDVYLVDGLDDTIDEESNTDTGDEIRTGAYSIVLAAVAAGKLEHATLLGAGDLDITGTAVANRLTGNSGVNTLIGNVGDDILDGGGGDDILKGGSGNDAYVIDTLGDVINEEGNADTADEVRSYAFSLDLESLGAGKIENATLLGSAALDLKGNAAFNILTGNAASNVLDGGIGDDALRGGAGNDIYIIDSVFEIVDEQGNTDIADEVRAAISINLSVIGGGAVENASLLGSGNDSLYGNDLANVLKGNGGKNQIYGGQGNDLLIGAGGDDYLAGGAGGDDMKGGSGNDTYVIDSYQDTVEEEGNTDIADGVSTSVDVDLTVLGGGAIENASAYVGEGTTISLKGNDSNNALTGNNYANLLDGGKGDDTLKGGGGADTLLGGDGDDMIVVLSITSTFGDGGKFDGGTGKDVLQNFSAINLDLTAISNAAIQGIEVISLTGAGSNVLRASAQDVADLSSSSTELFVLGDANDSIVLVDTATYSGLTNVGGNDYKTYLYASSTLYVDADMTTTAASAQVAAQITLPLMSEASGFRIDAPDALGGAVYATMIGAPGDVNQDGFEDVLINGPQGVSYLLYGQSASYDSPVSAKNPVGAVVGELTASGYTTVSGVGDFNGDGIADFALGDWTGSFSYSWSGGAYIVYGSTAAAIDQLTLSTLSSNAAVRLSGSAANEGAGGYRGLSTAGDMNGDGYDDQLLTAYSTGKGVAYVAFGRADNPGTIVGASLNGADGFEFKTVAPDTFLGMTVAGGSDYNGDGYDDIVVSSAFKAHVVFGHAGAFDADLLTSELTGSNGFTLSTPAPVGNFIVASGGDFNGDGFDDFIVTDWRESNSSKTNAGAVYVVFGKQSGFGSTFDLSQLDGLNGFKVVGAAANDRVGVSADLSGDFNGDGFDDLLIGTGGVTTPGSAIIVYGHAGAHTANMSTADLNGVNGVQFVGGGFPDGVGESVKAADLNGDGFDEVMIGAPDASTNGTMYVVYGKDVSGWALMGTTGSESLQGAYWPENIVAGQGNDVINGNGGADAINTGQGNDEIHVADNKFFRIDGGTGIDTLHLDYSGAIDFGNLDGNAATSDRNRIENVEVIDVANGHANALTLHLADVLDLDVTVANVGGVAALDNALRIDGEAGDTLQLFSSDGWGAADTASLAGYAIYTYQAVKVAVDTDIVVSVT